MRRDLFCDEHELFRKTVAGRGYMEERPIARAYRDARVQAIYGGTAQIMKGIIGRSLGL